MLSATSKEPEMLENTRGRKLPSFLRMRYPCDYSARDVNCLPKCPPGVEMISVLLDPLNAGERLSNYIGLPERLAWPVSDRNRMHPLP
jgi:hypothetical protein